MNLENYLEANSKRMINMYLNCKLRASVECFRNPRDICANCKLSN